ncbi:MAG: response regulator transcription factor [Saprospiraceae bacterium]|nr:response regulator transcription factor [Saprospiraceae bacterium]
MMHSNPKEIIIADPHPLFREAVQARLATWYPDAKIHAAERSDELLAAGNTLVPDLVIMELNLPPGDAIQVLTDWPKASTPHFILLSQYKDPKLVRDLCKLGAMGYIHKSNPAEELHLAIQSVYNGEVYLGTGISLTGQEAAVLNSDTVRFKDYFQLRYELTRREIEVLAEIKKGLSNREIAQTLYISEQTVCVHRKNILRKVGVNNTQKLLRITYEHHLA